MPNSSEDSPVYRKMLALYKSIPPGPDHTERFLEQLHGQGWKERAMRVGPLGLEFGRRLRELEARVARIERLLDGTIDWPKTRRIEPLPPWRREE